MRSSKLELYEDILETLSEKSLTVDEIAYACNMNCVTLRQRLNYLIENGLIEEKNQHNKTHFGLTRRGLAILKTLTITKRLKKMQISIKKIDKALQTHQAFLEHKRDRTKHA